MNLFNHSKIQELIDNGYNFDIGAYFSEGFDLTKKEAGLFIGYTFVYFLISMAASFIPLASLIIGPPLIAGYFLGAHKVSRGEVLDFGDFFKGFDYFGQLIIQQIILGLLIAAVIVPIIFLVGGSFAAFDTVGGAGGAGIGVVGVIAILIAMVAIFYLSVSYIFAQLFIIFGDMQAWDSMEASRKIIGKNFFSVFGLLLLIMLLNIGGMLLCGVGLLFTLPASYVIMYVAFRDLMQLDVPEDERDGDIMDHLVD